MKSDHEEESAYYKESSARLTWLLENQTVKWCRQDNARNLTISFENGPTLYVGIPHSRRKEIDISVVSGPDTSPAWEAHAESDAAPPPPKALKK